MHPRGVCAAKLPDSYIAPSILCRTTGGARQMRAVCSLSLPVLLRAEQFDFENQCGIRRYDAAYS